MGTWNQFSGAANGPEGPPGPPGDITASGTPTAHQTAVWVDATTEKGVGPGTTGQVWTSNGASADPSFQDPTVGVGGSALALTGFNSDGNGVISVPNSAFDASTGDVTLGAALAVNNPTNPITLTSAGGVSITDDNSDNGITILENADEATIQIENSGDDGYIYIIADSGVIGMQSELSQLDLDFTTPGVITASGPMSVNGNPFPNLADVTSAIGGSALTLGQQATADVVITGASAAIGAGGVVQVTPTGDVGDGFIWTGSLTDTDTITVKVICLVAGTPTSSTYNVKVF